METPRDPLPLAGLDLASSTSPTSSSACTSSIASTRLLREMLGATQGPSRALAPPGTLGLTPTAFIALERPLGLGRSLGLDLACPPVGCFSVGPGLDERLGLRLDSRVARTVAEVEERVRETKRQHHGKQKSRKTKSTQPRSQ